MKKSFYPLKNSGFFIRLNMNGKTFRVFKFRTIVTTVNDSKITKVGFKIRKIRVDENTNEMYATLLLPAGVTSLASIEFKDEDDIILQYTTKGRSVDDVYIKEVLPKKMKYSLQAIASFYFIKELDADVVYCY